MPAWRKNPARSRVVFRLFFFFSPLLSPSSHVHAIPRLYSPGPAREDGLRHPCSAPWSPLWQEHGGQLQGGHFPLRGHCRGRTAFNPFSERARESNVPETSFAPRNVLLLGLPLSPFKLWKSAPTASGN